MPRMVDLGVTKYVVVQDVADINAPTSAELTAGTDISEYVVTTTSVAPAASDTVNERSIVDTANVVVPTVGNYEGSLVLFRDFDSGVPSADDPLELFTPGESFYLVRRVGKPAADAFGATDRVDVFKFMPDNPQVMGGTGEGYLKATIPLLQQGQYAINVAVAGA